MPVISVIVGSTREGRFSEKPAHWILQHLKKREGVDTRLLDLRDFPMPFFDQPAPPAMPGRPPYKNEVVQRWTGRRRGRAGRARGARQDDDRRSAVVDRSPEDGARPRVLTEEPQ
jgi:NADPH-dependent FMN reductase